MSESSDSGAGQPDDVEDEPVLTSADNEDTSTQQVVVKGSEPSPEHREIVTEHKDRDD